MSIIKDLKRLFVYDDGVQPSHRSDDPSPAKRFYQQAGTSIDKLISLLLARPNKSGQTVTVESALGLSFVFRACDILGDAVASAELTVKRKLRNGDTEIAFDHPVHKLMAFQPHPAYTTYDLIHAMIVQVTLVGNSYAHIERDRVTRYPTKITLLEPSLVKMKLLKGDEFIYEYDGPKQMVFKSEDIIHLGGLSWNGLQGINVLDTLSENFGIALANQEYLAKFFRNGAMLSAVIRHPGHLSDDAADRIEESFMSNYGGVENAGLVPVLEEGMDIKPFGLTPNEAASKEVKQISVADISRITGVPQFLLEDLDRSTFNNVEHLSGMFLKHTIRPRIKRTKAEFDRKLFPQDEWGEYGLDMDIKELLIHDMQAKSQYIDTMMKWGILNRDEVRRMEGLNKIEDGSGQKYFIPVNMAEAQNLNNNDGQGNTQLPESGGDPIE